MKVLSRDSHGKNAGKFDLFERLNTYGQPLSPQELRNCILVSLNPKMFKWLKGLAMDEKFRNCTLLSESQIMERYDMDLVLRFLTLRDVDPREVGDVHEFLRDRMEEIALSESYNFDEEEKIFREVFNFLDEAAGPNSLRSWSEGRGDLRGGFSLAGFEGIVIGLGRRWEDLRDKVGAVDGLKMIKDVWSQPEYKKSFSGLRARERMARVIPAAERVIGAFC